MPDIRYIAIIALGVLGAYLMFKGIFSSQKTSGLIVLAVGACILFVALRFIGEL